jgi:hypothetical protein
LPQLGLAAGFASSLAISLAVQWIAAGVMRRVGA